MVRLARRGHAMATSGVFYDIIAWSILRIGDLRGVSSGRSLSSNSVAAAICGRPSGAGIPLSVSCTAVADLTGTRSTPIKNVAAAPTHVAWARATGLIPFDIKLQAFFIGSTL